MMVAFTAYFWILKTEEVYASETSVNFYYNIRRHIQELADDIAQKVALFAKLIEVTGEEVVSLLL